MKEACVAAFLPGETSPCANQRSIWCPPIISLLGPFKALAELEKVGMPWRRQEFQILRSPTRQKVAAMAGETMGKCTMLALLLLSILCPGYASRILPATDVEGEPLQIAMPTERARGELSNVGCNIPDPLFDPVYEVIDGRDVIWQTTPGAKAVLVMIHARGGDPFRYFDRTPRCPVCTGLPEDRLNILEGIQRGYGNVIAIRSGGYEYDMWPPEDSTDLRAYLSILEIWRDREGIADLPIVSLGVSNGGNFSTVLALYYHLDAIGLVVAPGRPEALDQANHLFPPTLFVYMAKDELVPYILYGISQVAGLGVDHDTIVCGDMQLYPLIFIERIPCFTPELSIAVFNSLRASGWINADGYLTDNPRLNEEWVEVLRRDKVLDECAAELCWKTEIAEELNVAYGVHAVTSLKKTEIFDWYDHVLFGAPYSYKHETPQV